MRVPEFPIDGPPPELRSRIVESAGATPQASPPTAGPALAGAVATAALACAGLASLASAATDRERGRSAGFASSVGEVYAVWFASFTGRRT